ncbi:class I SAM-dependent methyltransferase [Terrabacter sp. 2RAF25]|uniref:class I SAM-dependent methyltransferase n=1 Tax=Terrabacter sp. 2RAF25 TaxID=3232998 RepID=UPI003F992B9F
MPWDRSEPAPPLRDWVQGRGVVGDGLRAVVVGCGLGADAEFVAGLGFQTVAFDVAPSAVRVAQNRHPGSAVDYRVADLLDLPGEWLDGFDLVVEIYTVQALPDPPRSSAVEGVRSLVAPGGTLFAVEFREDGESDSTSGPPYALSRGRMRSFAGEGLEEVEVTAIEGQRWRAVFRR